MAEFPALPLFTDAYFADTRHLTTIQHGAYMLMLMTAWRSTGCFLPDDDNYLARICGMDKRTWLANKTTLLAFWKRDSLQNWVQGRLLDERNFVKDKRNKNAVAGKASALKRLNRDSTDVQPEGQHEGQQMGQQMPNITSTPTPTLTPIKEKEDTKKYLPKEKRAARLPDDFKPDASCHAVAAKRQFTADQKKTEFEKFKDYWRGKAGAAGTKLDWQATFRNWLRNATPQKEIINGNSTKPQHPATVAVNKLRTQLGLEPSGESFGFDE